MQLRGTLFIAAAALLAGCNVGPNYTRPSVPAAPAYKEQLPAEFKESNGWQQARPGDDKIRADWWSIFGSAELNALEEQINPSNQTLKAAEARFREARALIQLNRSNLYPTISTSPSITSNRSSTNGIDATTPRQYGNFILPSDINYELDA